MNFGPRNFRPGLSARSEFFLTVKLNHPHPHIHFASGRKSGPKIPWAEIPTSQLDVCRTNFLESSIPINLICLRSNLSPVILVFRVLTSILGSTSKKIFDELFDLNNCFSVVPLRFPQRLYFELDSCTRVKCSILIIYQSM
jgi:hypothetical protein